MNFVYKISSVYIDIVYELINYVIFLLQHKLFYIRLSD